MVFFVAIKFFSCSARKDERGLVERKREVIGEMKDKEQKGMEQTNERERRREKVRWKEKYIEEIRWDISYMRGEKNRWTFGKIIKQFYFILKYNT